MLPNICLPSFLMTLSSRQCLQRVKGGLPKSMITFMKGMAQIGQSMYSIGSGIGIFIFFQCCQTALVDYVHQIIFILRPILCFTDPHIAQHQVSHRYAYPLSTNPHIRTRNDQILIFIAHDCEEFCLSLGERHRLTQCYESLLIASLFDFDCKGASSIAPPILFFIAQY